MKTNVIIGASAVGSAVASLLAARGENVRLVTRRGGGPTHPLIERIAANAADADRLSTIAEGAAALFNCANPAYDRWLIDWPPISAALLKGSDGLTPRRRNAGGAVRSIASRAPCRSTHSAYRKP